MEITLVERESGVTVVALTGRLDLLTAPAVKARLAEEVAAGRRKLVIDLDAVSFIDSSGLGALIGALKAARVAGGDLRLARAPEQAQVLLRLTTLDRVMKPYAGLDEALAGF